MKRCGWVLSGFSVSHILQFCALLYAVRWKWASSVHKIFHRHSLSTSVWERNSKAKISLADRSKGNNSYTQLILKVLQCRMIRRTFFTMFTGLFSVWATVSQHCSSPIAQLWPILQLPSNSFAPSTKLHIYIYIYINLSFRIFESFLTDPAQSSKQHIFVSQLECPKLL